MSNQKVVVAFDGSQGSQKALRHTIDHFDSDVEVVTVVNPKLVKSDQIDTLANPDVATHLNPMSNFISPLQLNNVTPEPVIDEEKANAARESYEDKMEQIGRHILNEAKGLMRMTNKPVKTEIMFGNDPAQLICDHANKLEADLIVVGSRGLSGIKKLMLGSVSQQVVEKADCAVYVVK